MSDDLDLLRRRFDRERAARKAAETALEQQSWALYDAAEKLRSANRQLAGEVVEQQAARRASEATAAAIIEAAFDAVIAVDAAGVVLAWNRQAERVFGYPAADAVGRPVAELIVPPGDRDRFDRVRAELVPAHAAGPAADGDACGRWVLDRPFEATAVDRAGRRFPVQVAVTALPTASAATFGAFIRDVGQARQAERRREALYGVAAALAEAADVSTALPLVLRSVAEALGWDAGFAWEPDPAAANASDVVLRCSAAWVTADGAVDRDRLLAVAHGLRLSPGHGLPGQVWAAAAPVWIADVLADPHFAAGPAVASIGLRAAVGFPIRVDGRVVATMEFFHRHVRAAEADSVALVTAVGGQVGQFVRRRRAEADAEASAARAESASRAKSDFLANMSHEIRTPLNGVLGMLQLLAGTGLTDAQRRHMAVAEASAGALLTLINDILDLSKVEAGKLEVERLPFDLAEVAAGSVAIVAPRAGAKGLAVACEIAPGLAARRVGAGDRVRQVLVNLLGNAVKFTAAGSVTLAVSADADDPAGDVVRFAVTDTGIGIPADRRDRLFRPFSQVDASTTRKYGGTGLGLAISKQLAELMGGAIGVDSTPGRGSTFWFTARLPVDPTAAAAVDPIRAVAPVPAGRRVLVAEDNEVNQMVVGEMLRRLGYEPDVVENGHAAVLAAAGGGFDAVLMDCQMPVMDGFEAAAAIRSAEDGTGRRVPIIALTANALKGDRDRCLAAGMDDYLTKPIDAAALAAKLAAWLSPARRAA